MTIRSSGERVSRRTALAGILIVALAAFGQAALIEDTYSRADSSGLGITEVGGYAYTESNMQNWITNVAAIAGQQLHIHGYSASGPASTSNHGQAGLLAPDLTDTVHLPNVAISTDMSFLLSNTTGSNTTNNCGFIFRKPTATSHVETPGHVEAYMLPTGGVMLREKVGGTFYIRYRDNPFVAGDQSGTLNIFQGAGSLPTTINGQPFDADGDGRLEHDEPFHVQAVLVGDRLTFAINGQAVAAARTASDGSAVGTQTLSLCKNRYTSSASTIADPYFDNLSIDVPDYVIRHVGDNTPQAEGWTVDLSGSSTSTPGADEQEHWRLAGGTGYRVNCQATLTAAELGDADGWTATGVAKLNASDGRFQAFLGVDDGSDHWALDLVGGVTAQTGVYAINASAQLTGPLSTIDPTAAYHTYQIVYDPDTQIARYYLDGVGIGSQSRAGARNTTVQRVTFGDNISAGAASDSQWAFAQFEKGQTAMTGTVVEHKGIANPTTEGFTLDTTYTGSGYYAGPSADGQAWQVQQISSRRVNYLHYPDASNFSHPEGWTLSARVLLNSANAVYNGALGINDDKDAWLLSLIGGPGSSQTGLFTVDASANPVQLSGYDPTQTYQLYQMIYDPDADGGNGSVGFYLNGALMGVQTRAQARNVPANASWANRLWFGDNTSSGIASDSQWAWVRFETGQHIYPEPTTLSLLGLGLLAALRRRRKTA